LAHGARHRCARARCREGRWLDVRPGGAVDGVTRRRARVALCPLLCVVACRGEARPTGDAAIPDRVATAIPQIEKAVGVKFKTPPKWELRTRDQVRTFLVAQLDDSSAQRELAGKEAAYKVLGLIPDTMSVRRLLVDLLTEQILGYYDPKTKVLYVVQGAPDEYAGITITHELIH